MKKRRIGVLFLWFLLQEPLPVWATETVEQVVAVVNDQILFLSDLRRDALFFSEAIDLPLRKQIDRRIQHQLLLNEARQFVLDLPSAKEIEDGVKAVRRRFRNEREFQDRLTETGMTFVELKDAVTDRLLVSTFLEERIGFFIFVTDEEVEGYYQGHQNDFTGMSPKDRSERIQVILKTEKKKTRTEEYISQLISRSKIQINAR